MGRVAGGYFLEEEGRIGNEPRKSFTFPREEANRLPRGWKDSEE